MALHDWEATGRGDGVRVDECGPIRLRTGDDNFDRQKIHGARHREMADDDRPGDEQHDDWVREYRANPYCRHETREALHQRYQDIWVNTLVLKPSGRMGLTTDENWYRLQQHVLTEMLLRGEPPTPSNRHPRVPEARPFFDGDLCGSGGVVPRGHDHDVREVRRREHMEPCSGRPPVLNAATLQRVGPQPRPSGRRMHTFKGGYMRR